MYLLLLAIFTISSALFGDDFGKLRLERDTWLKCPSSPHKTIFTKTDAGNWRSARGDPTYPHQIFKHLSGQLFTSLATETNVIVTLTPSEADYEIIEINDIRATQYAKAEGMLVTLGLIVTVGCIP